MLLKIKGLLFLKIFGKRKSRLKPARWWEVLGLNQRPPRCQRGALPAELTPQVYLIISGNLLVVKWKGLGLNLTSVQRSVGFNLFFKGYGVLSL